jgi:hypothetical protein
MFLLLLDFVFLFLEHSFCFIKLTLFIEKAVYFTFQTVWFLLIFEGLVSVCDFVYFGSTGMGETISVYLDINERSVMIQSL